MGHFSPAISARVHTLIVSEMEGKKLYFIFAVKEPPVIFSSMEKLKQHNSHLFSSSFLTEGEPGIDGERGTLFGRVRCDGDILDDTHVAGLTCKPCINARDR